MKIKVKGFGLLSINEVALKFRMLFTLQYTIVVRSLAVVVVKRKLSLTSRDLFARNVMQKFAQNFTHSPLRP